jgi:lysozyme
MKTLILILLALTVSASELTDTIKSAEGLKLSVYRCTEGYPTIGYGHRCSADQKDITKEQAEEIFAADFAKAVEQVEALVGKDARQEVKDIVTEMIFQMGAAGVGKFKTMLKCIKAKNYKGASVAMIDSKWAKQTPERAKRMSELMRNVK